MVGKPTYEELAQRLKELEREAIKREQVDRALKESEERYRALVESSSDAILMLDKERKIVSCNQAFLSLFGYNEDEIKGRSIRIIHQSDDSFRSFGEKVYPMIERVGTYRTEWDLMRRDGTIFPVETVTSAIKSPDGLIRGYVAIIRDITERKRAEEAVRESEERFKEMATLLPTVIAELDTNFRLTYVNEAAFETFGYSQDDLEAGINVIDLVHPNDRERARRNLRNLKKGKKVREREYKVFRKDGSELTILVHSRPICKNGQITGIRSTLTDITRRKKAEEKLREREEELEIKSITLEEVNTALKVLLKRRDEERQETEEKILSNVREFVVPYLEKAKKTPLGPKPLAFLSVVETNLNNIISPFSRTLASKYLRLTPTEIHVANLVRQGNTAKQIAELMNLSKRTIESHRKNMRKKLGLTDRKDNLKTHLMSL